MDKNAIKNFAIWARNKLIADSVYKASLLGISEKGIGNPLPQSTADAQLFDIGMKEPYAITGQEISQRKKLVDAIKSKERDLKYQEAFQNVMEEVAYTWFNRLIAIRFMEVNDYMPSHIRVLSSENPSKAEPDLVTTPFDSDLSFSEKEKQQIIDWKNENKIDDVFRMLFIKQCNALNDPLPMLFEKISDYTELLLNVSVTDREGIVWHLVHDIPEDNFNVNAIGDDGQPVGQVEIIGWLYQYYNTEPKDQVFANLKKNIKITKETIPAATQLFTPDWIVRYMVENSLGRLWVEGHPNDELKSNWKYYLDEAKQEEDVQKQLDQIYAEHAKLKPEDITCMDPCCGSGHILVYMFEVLEQIYQSQGYSAREAAASIVEHNIYGLDIDKRAAQLAYFAVMMKARQYDRRFLARGIQPHVYAICESNSISEDCLQYFANGDKDLNREIHVLKAYMEDACEYGSLIQIPSINFAEINKRIVEIECEVDLYKQEVEDSLVPAIKCAEILSNKYQIVVTNPPYMGIGNISNKLYSYIVDRYKDFKQDIYCAFIKACSNMNSRNGIFAMITQQSFMTNSRFLATRKYITTEMYFINMAYIGTKGFDEIGGEKVRTCSFAARRRCLNDYQAYYIDLQNENCEAEKSERFHECKLQINSNNNGESIYKVGFSQYLKFSDLSFSFWVSNNIANISNSTGITIESIGNTRHGLVTGNGDRFMRFWYECPITNLAINNNNTNTTSLKWFPYSKGGTFRRWYGNREYVVNWENDGLEIRNYYVKGSIKSSNYNLEYNFKPSITWSDVRSGKFSARFTPEGALFDTSGPSLFLRNTEDIWWVLGLLNSDVTQKFLDVSCTGLHYTTGAVSNIPIQIVSTSQKNSMVSCKMNLNS